MKTKTNLKAGKIALNHNQGGLKVRSAIKASGIWENHNQSSPRLTSLAL